MSDYLIRPLQSDDLDHLIALEQACFNSGWSEQQLASYLGNSRSCSYLMLADQRAVGFAIFSTLLDEAELLQIGILPEFRGNGLAEQLLRQSHSELQQHQVVRVLLEVRISNAAAIALYRKLGYQQDAIRKGYYPGESGREDAVLMSYSNPNNSTAV